MVTVLNWTSLKKPYHCHLVIDLTMFCQDRERKHCVPQHFYNHSYPNKEGKIKVLENEGEIIGDIDSLTDNTF